MWNEQRNRFKSIIILLLTIFTVSHAHSTIDIGHLLSPQTVQDETFDHYHVMIEYMAHLFCTNRTYHFNHIYVERSLSTSLADKLINRINKCMTAGVLVSRYNFNGTDDFRIPYPRTVFDTTIGIHVYNLNIVRNIDTLNLNWIQDRIPLKPQVKNFILLEEELSQPADSKLMEIFSEIWSKNVLNVIIVYWNRTLSAVTFIPFPKMHLIFIPKSDLDKSNILFPDKTRDLQGYPLRVTGFYDASRAVYNRNEMNNLHMFSGIDGLLTRLIVEKMNATLNMSEPADGQQIGELFPNKTATGCLAALMSGDYDMGLNLRFYRLHHFEGAVEATHSNGRDDICFLVPRQGKAIDIANIFRPFRRYTWISIVVALPCYVLVFYFLSIRKKNKRSFQFHFFQFYGYLLQQPVAFPAEGRRQRILIACWIISVLLLSFMYQSKLSGTLIIPKDRPDIDTIEELGRSDLKIASFARYNRQIIQFFSDAKYNGAYKPLFKKLINCTISEFNELVGKFDPSYGFANKYHINTHLRRVYTLDSQVFFHQIKQCPVPFTGVYGIRYGTPFKNRINFILRQAHETGLIEKWERVNRIKEQKTQARLHSGHGNIPFNLVHLQTAFYVYCIGCVTAFGVFCLESIYKRFIAKMPIPVKHSD